MRLALRVAAAVLATAGALQAQAIATATVSIGGFSITLIDLDPNDGIEPAITFPNSISTAFASGATYSSFASAPGFFSPVNLVVSGLFGEASAAVTSQQALASARNEGVEQGPADNYFAQAEIPSTALSITPWTGLILRAQVQGTATTTIGVLGAGTEWASVGTAFSLLINEPGGTTSFSSSRQAFASYRFLNGEYVGESASFAGGLTFEYSNLSAATIGGSVSVRSTVSAVSSIAAIPENDSALMLGAGLAALFGLSRVRRRRS
jgi:hypothetical protein